MFCRSRRRNRRKNIYPYFPPIVEKNTLGRNAHWTMLKFVAFSRNTMPPKNVSLQEIQAMYGIDLQTFPTYTITIVSLQEIHLRYGKFINPKPLVVVQENEKEETPIQSEIFQTPLPSKSQKQSQVQIAPQTISHKEQLLHYD